MVEEAAELRLEKTLKELNDVKREYRVLLEVAVCFLML